MGGLVMALGAGSRLSLADFKASPHSMTLGFGTYGTKSMKTEDAIDLIAATGFDSVELTVWPGWDADPTQLSADRRRSIKSRVEGSGLVLTSLMENLHVGSKPEQRQGRLDRIRRAAQLAHELVPDRPPLMQTVTGGKTPWAEMRQVFIDEIGQWAKVAEEEDLLIAIKPHRGSTMSEPREAVELFQALGNPSRISICYDYSHFDFREMSIESTIATAMPRIGHVAVKDVVKQGDDFHYALPGEGGHIDYARLLRCLHDHGYRGDICCEVSGHLSKASGYDPLHAIRTCYSNLSAAFEKAGIPRPGPKN